MRVYVVGGATLAIPKEEDETRNAPTWARRHRSRGRPRRATSSGSCRRPCRTRGASSRCGSTATAIQLQIQKLIDTKGVGVSLYEKAWANSGALANVEQAIAKRGGRPLDIQPGTKGWSEHRADIVKELGGGAEAEAMVSRYERMKLGADAADPHAYLEERDRLRKILPDTEVERVRGLFPEYEVYVTGGATQTGKPIKGEISDIDVIVVVPKGTAPELMAAIEQRARGLKVRPDPEFIQMYGLPADKTIQVSAKVVTPEQFFGLTTATSGQGMVVGGKTPSPLNFTRIDVSAGQMDAAVMKAASPKQWVAYLRTRLDTEGEQRLAPCHHHQPAVRRACFAARRTALEVP